MWPFKKTERNKKKEPKEKVPQCEQISPELSADQLEEYGPAPYYAKVIADRDHGKGYWNTLRVGVFKRVEEGEDWDDEQVGEYIRTYHSLMGTFFPFERNGKWYALYSKDYTCTRVMSLPDCEDLFGQDPHGCGFCPVEFYIPQLTKYGEKEDGKIDWDDQTSVYCSFGFLCGCIWGDDCSWKIQYIDLSKVEEGELTIDDRFGYIELPGGLTLAQAISRVSDNGDGTGNVDIALSLHFRMRDGGELQVYGREAIEGKEGE